MLTARARRAFLERIALPGAVPVSVPDAEWRRFEALLVPRKIAKGAFFVRAGDAAGRFALILKGLFRFYYIDAAGREATKAFRAEHEVAAAYAEMLLGVRSRTFIEALEDSEVLTAEHAAFRGLYARHSCWQEIGRLMAEHHYLAKERRESEFLQLPAAERYGAFLAASPALAARLPQYLIASYLGVTPVALSRIVSRLRRSR